MVASTFEHTVTEADTAAALGSGDLPVLATPRLITWLERATFTAAQTVVQPPQTTVGTLVQVEHLKASPVGSQVIVTCSTPIIDAGRLIFHVPVSYTHLDVYKRQCQACSIVSASAAV